MLSSVDSFPPTTQLDLIQLIDEGLLVVEMIPKAMSPETIQKFFSIYGSIKVPFGADKLEALIVFSEKVNGKQCVKDSACSLGGMICVLASLERHSYLYDLSKPSKNLQNQKDDEMVEDQVDFDFQSQELAKQLINGYAKFIATTYLTLEGLSDSTGFSVFLMTFISWFSLSVLYHKTTLLLVTTGSQVKMILNDSLIGKPVVEKAELAFQIVAQIIAKSSKIIERERRQLE